MVEQSDDDVSSMDKAAVLQMVMQQMHAMKDEMNSLNAQKEQIKQLTNSLQWQFANLVPGDDTQSTGALAGLLGPGSQVHTLLQTCTDPGTCRVG